MYTLKKAWDEVSNQTFTNCFKKSGIWQNIAFDTEVTTSHGRITTADLIAEVTGTQKQNKADEGNDDKENEDTVTKPINKEVRRAISVLEDFNLFSNFGKAMMKSLKDLNQIVEKDVLNAQK